MASINQVLADSGIHRIVVPVPFPVEPLNVYVVEGPVLTLIDTPPRGPSFLKLLEDALFSLGFSVSSIRRIILTHPHFDHCGLAGEIVQRSGAEVWAAAGTIDSFRFATLEKEEGFHHDLLSRAGAPPQWIDYVEKKFGGWAREFGCDLAPSHYLPDRETLEMADGVFSVRAVPGHTPWCILIHDPSRGLAFTGDFLLQNISSNPMVQRPAAVPKGYGSLKALISSLEKTRKLALDLALPGHGNLIEDPNGRIDDLLRFIDQRKAIVYRIAASGSPTVYQMARKLFPRLRRHELFLAVSEIIGYLQVLEEEGKVFPVLADTLGEDSLSDAVDDF